MMSLLRSVFGALTLVLAGFAVAEPAKPQPVCNVLALSGGGSFGAVEIGMLDALVSSGAAPQKFDIVSGISAGGLNAGFLSYYDNISTAIPELKSIYGGLTTDMVYSKGALNIFTKWSIFDTAPLEKTLGGILSKKEPAAATGPLTMIGASNLLTEELDVFIFNDKTEAEKVDVLMATSAIPIAFPPRVINGTHYADGGVISNELINQVLGQRDCSFYNITFVNAHHKDGRNTITGFISFIEAVYHTVMNDYDSQLAQVTNCPYPKGHIKACYPTAAELAKYSILDFDNGLALFELGRKERQCFDYLLC